MQKARGIVRQAFLHRLAHVGADKKSVVAQAPLKAGLGVRRDAQGQQMRDFRVGKLIAFFYQSPDQLLRFGGAGTDEDMLAAPNRRQGLLGRFPLGYESV